MNDFAKILFHRLECSPDLPAYRFIQGSDLNFIELTYRDLWQQASPVAAQLRQYSSGGARVLLACKSQRYFAVGFYAAMMAGCTVVPVAIPRHQVLEQRLSLIANDAQASAVLTDVPEVLGRHVVIGAAALPSIDLKPIAHDGDAECVQTPLPAYPHDVALLQYTSGSTGEPKGVVITHDNLIRNAAAIQAGMRISSSSRVLTALPMFHDMGLVGGLMQPMYAGCIGYFLSPAEFVQYPERWLQAINRFGITVSGGPDFMYGLASRSVADKDLRGIDLSSWEIAFCGAEPIRPQTVRAFTQRFRPVGFRAEAFHPCYGMAESTLFITGKEGAEVPRMAELNGRTFISCGVAFGDTEFKIVDPDECTELGDDAVGEIWVRGSSVAQGYWRHPELSALAFAAKIAGDDDSCYLRTGDLGFTTNRQLFISGRRKDLIIAYGKKYAPQDIELDAESSHAAICPAGSAAFSVTRLSRERVALVAELTRTWWRRQDKWFEVEAAIRAAVQSSHGLRIDEIAFIKPGGLPRTSSGKVMRFQCRQAFLAGRWIGAKSQNALASPVSLAANETGKL